MLCNKITANRREPTQNPPTAGSAKLTLNRSQVHRHRPKRPMPVIIFASPGHGVSNKERRIIRTPTHQISQRLRLGARPLELTAAPLQSQHHLAACPASAHPQPPSSEVGGHGLRDFPAHTAAAPEFSRRAAVRSQPPNRHRRPYGDLLQSRDHPGVFSARSILPYFAHKIILFLVS